MAIEDNIVARNFDLTTDNWGVNFYGTINSTSVGGGGTIQFNTGGDLTLEPGSSIVSPGATVFLNTADSNSTQPGNLNFYGSIDLSGQAGGIVHFRALQNGLDDGVYMNFAGGRITGVSSVIAEAVLIETPSGGNITAQDTGSSSPWLNALTGYMNTALSTGGAGPTLQGQLNLVNSGAFQFLPGLEVRSTTGNLTLGSTWDLTSWRYNGAPGFLTLRAAGDLDIDYNLVDHPASSYSSLYYGSLVAPSWGMSLVSGADFTSSAPTAFNIGTGNLNIGQSGTGVTVYTQSAPLILAAGNNIIVNSGAAPVKPKYMISNTMSYNVATFSGPINVTAGNNVILNNGGVIESATGEIDVNAGGYLTLWDPNNPNYLGAIRTTGESPGSGSSMIQYWNYKNGGSIAINVKGAVNGYSQDETPLDLDGWDTYTKSQWSASYTDSSTSKSTEGLATMAGGNLTVVAGGSFTCQAGTFGAGNLDLFSGGDMNGRLLVYKGSAELNSMGNFGNLASTGNQYPIEEFNAQVHVFAQGEIDVGAIVNPTIARPYGPPSNDAYNWDLEYAPTTSVSLTASTEMSRSMVKTASIMAPISPIIRSARAFYPLLWRLRPGGI